MFGYFSLFLVLVYFSCVCNCRGISDSSALGYKYNAQIGGSLKLNQNLSNWVDARDSCREEGAFLVSDWTIEIATAVYHLQSQYSVWRLYSGVHLTQVISTEGGSTGTSGLCDVLKKPISWAKTEQCGVFYNNGSTGFVDCKLRMPFICYLPENEPQPTPTPQPTPEPTPQPTPEPTPQPTPQSTTQPTPLPEPTCGSYNSGYEYSNKTKRCYKMHIDVKVWVEAKLTCILEGAQLTVPNSRAEVDVITAMHNRYSDSEIRESQWPNWSHIGAYYESGVWLTLDGTTLADSGYMKWGENFPSHQDSLAECPYVCMSRDGDYSNMCYPSYHDKYPFVCEKRAQF